MKLARRSAASLLVMAAVSSLAGPSSAQETSLPDLLDVMARVAALYRDAALGFTCEERLTDTHYRTQNRIGRRRTYRFDYFYVFHDEATVDGSGGVLEPGLQDYRTHRNPDDPYAEPERVDPGEVGLSAHLKRPYSWVFVFLPRLRDRFVFALVGEEKIDGRDMWVLSFEPTAVYERGINEWFGRAWIDQATFQLARVDAAQSQEYRLRAHTASIQTGGRFLFAWARTEFGYEKNGLRFPSDAVLVGGDRMLDAGTDAEYRMLARRIRDEGLGLERLFRVQHMYRNYRFFSVRTATEIDTAIHAKGSQ